MSDGLTITPEAGPGQAVVLHLAGCVDERADLSPLRAANGPVLVLDLAEVRRINSVGVREWIRAMKTIPTDVVVYWDNVSTAMVAQLNMIANFNGHSRVRSFYAPYYCPACDLEQRFLLQVSDVRGGGSPTAPEHSCAECGGPLEFDDIEEDYLGALLEAA